MAVANMASRQRHGVDVYPTARRGFLSLDGIGLEAPLEGTLLLDAQS